jgi:hypothetical protein
VELLVTQLDEESDTGVRICRTRAGVRLPISAKPGAGGGAAAVPSVQWSQACDGAGVAGDCPSAEPVALWQMIENGSAEGAAAVGAAPHKMACMAIA